MSVCIFWDPMKALGFGMHPSTSPCMLAEELNGHGPVYMQRREASGQHGRFKHLEEEDFILRGHHG